MHTSYGYIFNRDISRLSEVESDFDEFLEVDGVTEFEPRAVIPFPNFIHRHLYDGAVARVGNAAFFMEPLEATAIVSAQLQIGMILHVRLNRSVKHLEARSAGGQSISRQQHALLRPVPWVGTIPVAPGTTVNSGATLTTRRGRVTAAAADPGVVGCAALDNFGEMIDLLKRPVIDRADWHRMCAVPLTSYAQMAQGLGC